MSSSEEIVIFIERVILAERKAHQSRILSALKVLGYGENCHIIRALAADPRLGAASCYIKTVFC